MTDRENYLRNARLEGPDWMPCTIAISGASWDQWRGEMEDVCARHPILFPGFEKGQRRYDEVDFGPAYRARERFTDNWGCVWESSIDGIEGVAIGHPLADWAAFESWSPPDALHQLDRSDVDWKAVREANTRAEQAGQLTMGGTAHGFLLLRLTYLRGFENLMLDLATGEPRLHELIARVMHHNEVLVDQYLSMGVDVMGFAEDLGTQTASLVSPGTFRQWFTPQYRRLMSQCKPVGTLVHLHSDGYVMELLGEFLTAGVDIVNVQDLCNGIGDLARELKGRACVDLDIDRQSIVPFGSRSEIRALIEEETRTLGSHRGGLSMICGIYPPTPPENVDALCCAMEEFRTYWADRR